MARIREDTASGPSRSASTEQQLYAERERYRTLIEQIDIGIFRSDADHGLVFVNEQYLRMMGVTAAELAGFGWHDRVHPEDRERVRQKSMAAADAHDSWSDEYRVLSGPGVVLLVRASARPLHDEHGRFAGYLGTCLDLTELRSAEDDRRQAAVAQAAREVSDAAASRLQTLIAGLSAVIWERDARTQECTFITERVVDVLGYPLNAWMGRRDFWSSILHWADREQAMAIATAGSTAGRDWEHTYRVVAADGRTVWLHELVHVVKAGPDAAATLLGVLIDVTEQKRQGQTTDLLVEVGTQQWASGSLADRLTALVEAAVPMLAELSAVLLLGPDDLLRPFVAAAPEHPDVLAAALRFAPLPVPASLADRFAAGRAFMLPGDGAEVLRDVVPSEDEVSARVAVGVHDRLIVPLNVSGRLLGLLSFASITHARTYDAFEIALAEELGRRVALMIEADRSTRREHRLWRINAGLASADTPAAVARVLMDGFAEAFGASGQSVFAMEPEGGVLRSVASTAYPTQLVERFTNIRLRGRSPIVDCARSGEPVWLADDAEWAARYPQLIAEHEAVGACGALVYPLHVAGRVVGVVVASFPTRRTFPQDERESIAVMVGQAAHAFQRAVEAEQRRNIAEILQHSLLPPEPPLLDRLALATRYLPGVSGVQAGGDWFDVVPLDEHRTAIVVGDVVGQGAPAAAVMGQLRSALSSALLLVDGPAAALAHLDLFARRIPGARASTAVCLVVDTATGQARWARAGHVPPLLVPQHGTPRHLDGGAGPLLGVFPAAGRLGMFTEGVIDVGPGDALVLYTDGLVERRGEPIDDGMDRLALAASALADADPARLVTGLLAAGVPVGGGNDDIALIAARFLPPPLHQRRPARPEELVRVRRTVQEWLSANGFAEELSYDLQLALGEAVVNAVEHAYPAGADGEFEFTVRRHADGGGVDVEVVDFGHWRSPSVDAGFRGRGLGFIRALAEPAVIEPGPGGTTVRFTMRAAESEPAPGVAVAGNATAAPVGTPAVVLPSPEPGGGMRFALPGDIDLAAVNALRPQLLSGLNREDGWTEPAPLIIDLAATSYLASAGVGLLLDLAELAPAHGWRLRVEYPPVGAVARVLELAGWPFAVDGPGSGESDER